MKTNLILAMAILGTAAGCAGPPTEPTRQQEWMTLEDYRSRGSANDLLLNPVVTVPEGTEVALRISRKPIQLLGEGLDFIFYDALEPVDDQMVTVRLRARKTVHLDLEHLLASTDRKSWMPLAFHFFPFFRYSKVTVSTNEPKSEVVVPVTASFEGLSITRDFLGGLGPR